MVPLDDRLSVADLANLERAVIRWFQPIGNVQHVTVTGWPCDRGGGPRRDSSEGSGGSRGYASPVDAELEQLAKERLGERYGLTPGQSHRLRGDKLAELEADAATMCRELGLPVPGDRDRDEHGRFRTTDEPLDMNRAIRQAAGR